MSLFQTDRCIAVLCPNEVAVYRPVRGKTSVIATEDAAAVFAVRSTAERPAWEGAIEELAAWLVRSASSSMRLHVILSNRFVRFACVPWSEAIASESELQIVAELVMDSCYGDMNGWTVSLDNGGWGKARLACAVENALLARLREAVEVMRMDCQCIEPYFVTCWNRWCGELPVDNALLAVAEPRGPTVVASLRGGMWHSVRATSGEQEAMSLRRLLDKEMLLQGFESMPGRWLHCPSLASDCAEFIGTSIRVLVPQKHASSMSMTMALVGNGE